MSYELVIYLLLGAAAGGFINGLAGFGTALLALGIWLQVMPPWQAVAIVAAMSVISGAQALWLIRQDISSVNQQLPRFLIPALVALPLGTVALDFISASTLKLVIAGFMLLYGAFFSLRRSLPQLPHPMPLVDSLVGFLGGLLGGAASLSGPLPTMWAAMQPWTKVETSAILRLYNVAILTIAVAIFAWKGYYNSGTLQMIVIALPATLASSQLGIKVFRRLSDIRFRRIIIWLLFVSGLLLMIHELF